MKKDVSKFRPFGCKAYVHLNKERRDKGKHTPFAVEAINLGFASDCNMSVYKFIFPRLENVLYHIKPDSTRSHSLTGIRT
jgi:hypothetical protein